MASVTTAASSGVCSVSLCRVCGYWVGDVHDSEPTDTVDGAYDGNRASATPEYNVNLGRDVPGVKGLTLTARGIHSSSQYLDQNNSKKIDGWGAL